MKKSDFYYDLPEELIAQTPLTKRDSSRLLCLNKATGAVEHKHFHDIYDMLGKGDVLVLNDSRVMPSRLLGHKEGSTGAMEFLLLEQKGHNTWETMVRPGKKAKVGARFVFGEGLLTAEIMEVLEGGNRLVSFTYEGNFFDTLNRIGQMPLPPYITEKLEDKERYQTVYSRELGSAAAPTAGLHFTPELLEELRAKGVEVVMVTLHVGLGTFRPVKVDDITEHHMHSEHYEVSEDAARIITAAKKEGRRVIGVGTTSCRTLESAFCDGELKAGSACTNIFIYPGYNFKCIDALITNFHLPESTLIMLVSALAGYDHTMNAYKEAVRERYRFFSFGDAMFIHD
ncbi:MAG: tRNA preQ1(34) S-adenosylmethionine ribosyltransferase-isomerase QueA [Angelakisella sp.]